MEAMWGSTLIMENHSLRNNVRRVAGDKLDIIGVFAMNLGTVLGVWARTVKFKIERFCL